MRWATALAWRRSRRFVLMVVFMALFVDALLVTLIVPLAPFLSYFQDNQMIGRGLLFASKGIVQLLCDPLVRTASPRLGRSVPILFGNMVIIGSALMLAFVNNLHLVIVARAIQGIGSSCVSIAGLGLLADTFEIDEERDQAVGKAMGGVALGIMLGPPIGGVLFLLDDGSYIMPLIVIAGLAAIDSAMCLLLDPVVKDTAPLFAPALKVNDSGLISSTPADDDDDTDPITSIDQVASEMQHERAQRRLTSRVSRMLADPHVLVVFGAIILSAFVLSSLEPTLPFYWVDKQLTSSSLMIGLVFAVAATSYAIVTPFVAWLGMRVPRFLLVMLGLSLLAGAMPLMSVPGKIGAASLPLAIIGCGMSLVDVSALPMLATIVEKRHSGEYNLVFALAEMSTTTGRIAGALLAAWSTRTFMFLWTTLGIGLFLLSYSPLLFLVRKSSQEENIIEPFSTRSPKNSFLYAEHKNIGPPPNVAAIFADQHSLQSSSTNRVTPELTNNAYEDDEDDNEVVAVYGSSFRTETSAGFTPTGSFVPTAQDSDHLSTISGQHAAVPQRMSMLEFVMQTQLLRASSSYYTSLRTQRANSPVIPRTSSSSGHGPSPRLGGLREPFLDGTL